MLNGSPAACPQRRLSFSSPSSLPVEIKHEYCPCLNWEETSAATATAMQEKVDEKTEGTEGEKCTRIGESVEKRCVTPWKECHTQEGEETEDEVRQTDQEKAEGKMILACKEKAAIENEIVRTRTQNVRVQLEWMEARHHADKVRKKLREVWCVYYRLSTQRV